MRPKKIGPPFSLCTLCLENVLDHSHHYGSHYKYHIIAKAITIVVRYLYTEEKIKLTSRYLIFRRGAPAQSESRCRFRLSDYNKTGIE